jgi:uncharacterized membrane protein YhaH (DUF805 family)
MRRDYLWYGIAVCWATAAVVGMLRHHTQQAIPAAFFAIVFAVVGVWIGKRDQAIRARRLAAKK